MLTYFRFLLLSLEEKRQYLNEKGTFLLSHTNEKGLVRLYAAGDFFVELSFDQQQNCASEVIAFKSLNRLQQHAEHIDLIHLINP
jgi:CRP-like cAMP-binding protein